MGELAIGLENKPPLDHHVDASDSGKGDLNLKSKAGLPHDAAQHRLLPRLAAPVNELTQVVQPVRQAGEDVGDIALVDELQEECVVDRRQSMPWMLAQGRLHQRIHQTHARLTRVVFVAGGPVQHRPGPVVRAQRHRSAPRAPQARRVAV